MNGIKSVDDFSTHVDSLKQEFELQNSIKEVTHSLAYRIQNQRDKICDVLRKVQSRRDGKSSSHQLETELDAFIEDYREEREQNKIKSSKDEKPKVKETVTAKKQQIALQRRKYIIDFKKYLVDKNHRLQQQEEFKRMNYFDLETKGTQKWVKTQANPQNDKIMFEYFFRQIDKNKKNQINDVQVIDFMKENPLIMELFNIEKNLQGCLDKFPRKLKQQFNQDELIKFFLQHSKQQKAQTSIQYRDFVHLFDPAYKALTINDPNSFRICLLSEITLEALHKIFQIQDIQMESAVEQDALIAAIRQNPNVPLFENAVHLVERSVNIHLESALQMIEMDGFHEVKMISWNKFLNYFSNFPDEPQRQIPVQNMDTNRSDDNQMTAEKPRSKQISPEPVEQSPIKLIRDTIRPKNFGQVYHPERIDESKITVPRSLSCSNTNKKPSKRDMWVQALVEDKNRRDRDAHKYIPFKAHAIPEKVKDRNLYTEMLQQENERRKDSKERNITKMNELIRPFSFDQRGQLQHQVSEEEKYLNEQSKEANRQIQFRANPAPWFCSVELYQRKLKDEAEASEIRKQNRKNWQEVNSKMPRRMQMHQDKQAIKELERQAGLGYVEQLGIFNEVQLVIIPIKNIIKYRTTENCQAIKDGEFTFYPKQNVKLIPNFKKLHRKYDLQLQKIQQQKKLTKPKAPKFNQSRSSKQESKEESQNITLKYINPIVRAQKVLSKKPKIPTQLTKKFMAQMENLTQERQFKHFLEAKKQFEEQQRKERKQLFVPRVQNSWVVTENDQAREQARQEKIELLRQQQQVNEEEFNGMMKDIFLRVYQRPLLMEQVNASVQDFQQLEEDEGQEDQNQLYGYNQMNPIGEDDELEYMKQQQEEDEQYQDEDSQPRRQIQYQKNQQEQQQEDPEGVDLVGDEAEQSNDEVEFAKGEGQYEQNDQSEINPQFEYQEEDEEDGEEYIDLDNIDPELLKQLQEQALAEGYNLVMEGYDQNQYQNQNQGQDQYQEGEQYEYEEEQSEDKEQFVGMRHHSF